MKFALVLLVVAASLQAAYAAPAEFETRGLLSEIPVAGNVAQAITELPFIGGLIGDIFHGLQILKREVELREAPEKRGLLSEIPVAGNVAQAITELPLIGGIIGDIFHGLQILKREIDLREAPREKREAMTLGDIGTRLGLVKRGFEEIEVFYERSMDSPDMLPDNLRDKREEGLFVREGFLTNIPIIGDIAKIVTELPIIGNLAGDIGSRLGLVKREMEEVEVLYERSMEVPETFESIFDKRQTMADIPVVGKVFNALSEIPIAGDLFRGIMTGIGLMQ